MRCNGGALEKMVPIRKPFNLRNQSRSQSFAGTSTPAAANVGPAGNAIAMAISKGVPFSV